jgi:isochorismate synthase
LSLQKLLLKAKTSFKQQLPFVIYRKPNTKTISGLFGSTSEIKILTSFEASGFVFAPFSTLQETILFPFSEFEEKTAVIQDEFDVKKNSIEELPIAEHEKERYKKLIQQTVDAIKEGLAEKIVISRKDEVALKTFDFQIVLERMLTSYKNALVYCWYHPKVGLWMGATPERLLEIKEDHFKTTALAGTQPYTGTLDVVWGEKEQQEQQIVTDYILNAISGQVDAISTKGPYTVKAGSLLHLKTDIEGSLKEKGLLYLISKLHPTPAVCGMPKEEATNFILQNEAYNRSFYTGFLGELNAQKSTSLFVNLRCMQIQNKLATVFIGGGITKDSIPENEWDETVKKAATMKSVL